MKKPKIVIYDIETSPNIAYSFGGKWEVNIAAFQQYTGVLSFAYKFLGEDKVYYHSQKTMTEKQLLTKLAKVMNEADVLIAHNGDAFDQKVSKTRMLEKKLPPVKKLTTIDTKKVAKRYFSFPGNSLEDLAKYLNLGGKVKHPGIDLWLGCMAGENGAWLLMERYNRHDVVLLEQVYLHLKPWIENHPQVWRLINPEDRSLSLCPNCGSRDCQKRGLSVGGQVVKQRWSCRGCNAWFQTRREATGKGKNPIPVLPMLGE